MKFLQTLMLIATAVPTVFSATLQQVHNYGNNPGNVEMWTYIPDCLVGKTGGRPAVVALHYCQGTAHNMYAGAHDGPSFRQLADKYGFVVIYPNALNDPGNCWDVHSTKGLTRGAGGEPDSIVAQVNWAVNNYNIDASKVFIIGLSSGAMMVNVMAALYPDKFAGGAVYAGVAYPCFQGTGYWNNACADGLVTKTAQEWGNLVRAANNNYGAQRPKIQVFHNTPDDILDYVNMEEQVKQWTNVFGYPISPVSVQYGSPTSAWTRRIYGERFQALTSTQYTHIFPIQSEDTVDWFGLKQNVPTACSNPVTTTNTVTPPTSTWTTIVGKWQQCGGVTYNGPTICATGLTCQYVDPYYWQCKEPL